MIHEPDRLLTSREVCQLLRISLSTLQALRREHKIAFIRYGHRSMRFRHEAVINFLRRTERDSQFAGHVS